MAGTVPILAAGAQENPPTDSTGNPLQATLIQYAWWNKAQQSPAGGTPVPAPPTAPADGIYVAYEAVSGAAPTAVSGPVGGLPGSPVAAPVPVASPQDNVLLPTAYGAVRFSVPEGAEGELTLQLNARSASTPAGADPNLGPTLLCLATSTWDPVQNGRFDGAPSYDCGTAASATIVGDQITFTIPTGMVANGLIDVVLVPVGTTPFNLSIARPTDSSFVITNADALSTFDSSAEPDATFVIDDYGSYDTVTAPDLSVAGDFAGDATGSLVTPAVTTTPRSIGRGLARPASNVLRPFSKNASRTDRAIAFGLLLLIGVALWWIGGQPVRGPRLLGSMGSGAADVTAGPALRVGGIGRFARPRTTDHPPPLT